MCVIQGFTYVAPSVLESLKEGFSVEPRLRPVRRHNSSPRTPIRCETRAASWSLLVYTHLSVRLCQCCCVWEQCFTVGDLLKKNFFKRTYLQNIFNIRVSRAGGLKVSKLSLFAKNVKQIIFFLFIQSFHLIFTTQLVTFHYVFITPCNISLLGC